MFEILFHKRDFSYLFWKQNIKRASKFTYNFVQCHSKAFSVKKFQPLGKRNKLCFASKQLTFLAVISEVIRSEAFATKSRKPELDAMAAIQTRVWLARVRSECETGWNQFGFFFQVFPNKTVIACCSKFGPPAAANLLIDRAIFYAKSHGGKLL